MQFNKIIAKIKGCSFLPHGVVHRKLVYCYDISLCDCDSIGEHLCTFSGVVLGWGWGPQGRGPQMFARPQIF